MISFFAADGDAETTAPVVGSFQNSGVVQQPKEKLMFWIALLVVGAAMTFSTLGAMSVWLKLFAIGFKFLLALLSVVTLWFVWKRFLPK
jgi:hypothetical protein